MRWEGISGGDAVELAVGSFFDGLGGAPRERGRGAGGDRAAAPPRRAARAEFEVLAAAGLERAAAPTLGFGCGSPKTAGGACSWSRSRVLIEVEPAKRSYDDAGRERLVELFGEPERWATTAQSFRWSAGRPAGSPFTGSDRPRICPIAVSCDLELATSKYFDALPEGEAPLLFHFNGTVFYEAEDGRLQLVQVPWSARSSSDADRICWQTTQYEHPPPAGCPWIARRCAARPPAAARGLHVRRHGRRAARSEEAGERRGSSSWSPPCSSRATRSTPTPRGAPRTRPRPRSGSSTRPPMRRGSTPPSTACGSSACSRPRAETALGSRCASCRRPAPATERSSSGWSAAPPSVSSPRGPGAGSSFPETRRCAAAAAPGDPGRATGLYQVAACVHNETELPSTARSTGRPRWPSLLSTHA